MFLRITIIALLLVSFRLHAGELIDRIAATVNTHVILQSDWDDEVHFESFMSGREPQEVTAEQRKAALYRLIDQALLREQIRVTDLNPASTDEIKKQMDDLKDEQLGHHPGQSWKTTISRYQLTDKVIKEHVAAELEQFRMIDLRFRPSIQISSADVEKYYREQILPKLPASDPLGLNAAAPKIREILIQEKINQLLNSWLETLRSQTQIRIFDSQPSPVRTR
jgi:peptidyl-prolyl cis-trans isomerase SurA